ncbi:single-stranded-DNA-specific exonuclease RecJ [Gracilibacillus alcaliphilus]|uniref:single-stranded-DNA-specific exonuclease RecJ n=1 Tax=Gracilibacillus alcaliphilus TaxID=1401441 RepID=UPI00195EF7E0|nr:single-stranded-DNA-specific exonuclease RecJ [Gracilibacillus alcaliphilus]MBM7678589.1 single-stranded-DNA-specific exonuclease [Gracilibacillus alcaliphilus]
MLESQSNWKFTYKQENNIDINLLAGLNVSPVIKELLIQRGIETNEQAEQFLHPSLEGLHPTSQFTSMDMAIERVKRAIEQGESILVYGDYDADGVTSTTVMVEALRESGAMCDYYIPNRFTEGYGPNEAAFQEAFRQGFQLIITVDNGIAGDKEVALANELGIDVIITDHHEVQEVIPEAYAIIHPKCSEQYPFKELAGVGVAFKFAEHLLGYFPKQFLDLVAIGTIADLVPLQGENRILTYYGLQAITTTSRMGIQALKKQCQLEDYVTEEDIGFRIAPRLNAVGRLQDANLAVDLLLTEDPEEAEELASYIQGLNTERQKIVANITEEAIALYEEQASEQKVIVVAREGWNQGVLGIVASKLIQAYHRPAIVLALDSEAGQAKGSARSIDGFDMFKNCMEYRELFTHFGGHAQAAGMTLPADNIDILREKLGQLADEQLKESDFKPQLLINGDITISQIDMELIKEMQQLAPFGMGNPKPLFHIEAVPAEIKQIGATKNHLKLKFTEEGTQLDAVCFGFGSSFTQLAKDTVMEVIAELQVNEWNGIRKPQLMVKDIAVSSWQLFDYRGVRNWQAKMEPAVNHICVSFRENQNRDSICFWEDALAATTPVDELFLLDIPYQLEDLSNLLQQLHFKRLFLCFETTNSSYFTSLPSREEFKWLYQLLRQKGSFDYKAEAPKLAQYKGWKLDKIKFMFQVFHELNFVTRQGKDIIPTNSPSKKDLTEATVYQERKKQIQLEEILVYSSYKQLREWINQQVEKEQEEVVYGL